MNFTQCVHTCCRCAGSQTFSLFAVHPDCCLYLLQGASVVLYRNCELRKYQIFAYTKWIGGLFGSPGVTGTRPGKENVKN